MTVIYKPEITRSDPDCLSRAPVEPPPKDDPDDDCFLGTLSTDGFTERQRADSELRSLVEYLKNKAAIVKMSFFLRNDILLKKNFSPL